MHDEPLYMSNTRRGQRWVVFVVLLTILARGLWDVGNLQPDSLATNDRLSLVTISSARISSTNNSSDNGMLAAQGSKSSHHQSSCPSGNNMKHFDAMYIMYMPQRREYIEQVVEYYGFAHCFDIIYVPAINKSSIDKQWFQNKGFVASPFKLGIGKIANHLTLLKTLRLFLYNSENGDDSFSNNNNNNNNEDHSWMESRCIILEDDIATLASSEQLSGWWRHFSKVVGDMKRLDWDYVNFGRCYASCKNDNHVMNDIVHYNQAACTHAVGYSYAGALKAMQTYLPLRDRSNDLMIADQITSGKFDGKAYQITPILFKQNETMKSLLTDHGKSWEKPECSDTVNQS
ncbi:unnamed protein product [Cylindrotheca closterium]|uniref:Uncharacterized protein n=1 Tax=Cylindrotheca closterium TaxID=2856 RepID=A0AAD2FEV6_9STRA|nr:unnamed protein product [Cylindrotheca closterium]